MSRSRALIVARNVGLYLLTAVGLSSMASLTTWAGKAGELGAMAATMTPLPAPFYRWEIVAFGLLGATALGGIASMVIRFAQAVRQPRRLAVSEGGQAIVEMAIIFPLCVIMVMGIIQLSLLFNSQNFVQYAAWNAVRSASVWIPADVEADSGAGTPAEAPGQVRETDGEKWQRIKMAAALSVMPICPKSSLVWTREFNTNYIRGLINSIIYGALSAVVPSIGEGLDKLDYAEEAVSVNMWSSTNGSLPSSPTLNGVNDNENDVGTWPTGTQADVTVEVQLQLYMMMPMVAPIFGNCWDCADRGARPTDDPFTWWREDGPVIGSGYWDDGVLAEVWDMQRQVDYWGALARGFPGWYKTLSASATMPLEQEFEDGAFIQNGYFPGNHDYIRN